MPELPEVETVRRGLQEQVVGRTLTGVQVRHPRATRRQAGGASQFEAEAAGARVTGTGRRGKYLWLTLSGTDRVLVAHLGMSGQFRLVDGDEPDPHVRVAWRLADGGALVFRDQRTFGWVVMDDWVEDVPAVAAHIAPDPFDPLYDAAGVNRAIRHSRSGIKRVLLAQTYLSGVGNIYADEALWRARLHPEHPADRLSAAKVNTLLGAAREVMAEALAAGGTSFDPLYVAINGESGWFERGLDAYGRQGLPCRRCGTPIIREQFTNRSSHRCPRCQRAPRRRTPG